jgi:AAA15 family ATPase/GTPase
MITKLSCKNFKSWQSLDPISIGKLSCFFGANSSGKTSILDILLLMKQTIESTDRKQVLNFGNVQDYIQLGSYHDMIFNQDLKSDFEFSVGFQNEKALEIRDAENKETTLFKDNALDFSTSISQTNKNRLYVNEFSYGFDKNQYGMKKKVSDEYKYELSGNKAGDKSKLSFTRAPGRPWQLPEPVKFYGFPEQARTYYQNIEYLFDLPLALENNFSNIYYLGPLREYPMR